MGKLCPLPFSLSLFPSLLPWLLCVLIVTPAPLLLSSSSPPPPSVCLYSSSSSPPLFLRPVSGGHSRSNSGGSESSLPSLARSMLLVDQLIDL